jgi:CubicO group peptidase (beta-lactamase class C family)
MKKTGRTLNVILIAAGLFLVACVNMKPMSAAGTAFPKAGDAEITDILAPICLKYGVPAMSMAIIRGDGMKKYGVVGVRKSGSGVAATLDDMWHLGSDTKAMTAALAGIMVDGGRLKWTTTMEEAFPEFSSAMHPDFRKVELIHLLSHRAGLPANLDYGLFAGFGGVRAQRLALTERALSEKPKSAPGEAYLYSNLGYIIAGAMIEKAAGMEWEEAMRRYVFEPLGMRSVGFGGMGTPGKIDQPWGHLAKGKPVKGNGPEWDNPPVAGPAGRVHCGMRDWALFLADQLRGARGEAGLLSPESYRTLFAPPFGGDYALGWIVQDRPWADGKAYTHSGSNTMNFSTVWMAPNRDFAVLACTNMGLDAAGALDQAISTAILSLADTIVPREGK